MLVIETDALARKVSLLLPTWSESEPSYLLLPHST